MPKAEKIIKKSKETEKITLKKKIVSKAVAKKPKPILKTTPIKKLGDSKKQKTTALIKKIKTAEKIASAESLFKKTIKKTSEKIKKDDEIVILPNKVNQRLLDKVKHYQDFFYEKGEVVVIRTAIIGGYVFIFSGLLFCLLSLKAMDNYAQESLLSNACSGSEVCLKSTQKIQETQELTAKNEPILHFLNSPTTPITADFNLQVSAKFIENPQLILTSQTTGENFSLKVSDKNNDSYTFTLPAEKLKDDNFSSMITTSAAGHAGSTVYFQGPSFLQKTTADLKEKETAEASSTQNQEEKSGEEEKDEVSKTEQKEDLEKIKENNDEAIAKNSSSTKPVTTTESASALDSNNSLNTLLAPETKSLKVRINAPQAKKVEIFAQKKSSDTTIYLGLATKTNDDWLFFIKNNSLPNGDYFVFAKASNENESFRTGFSHVQINHSYFLKDATSSEDNTNLIILTEKVKKTFSVNSYDNSEDEENSPLTLRSSYFNNFEEASKTIGQSKKNTYFNEKINALLKQNETKLNNSLLHYASAFIVQNQSLVTLGKNKLQELKQSLNNTLQNEQSYSDAEKEEISFVLTEKFNFLQKQVEEQETLLQSRSDLIKKDTDNDGISDFDEINLYNTDPLHPDTDKDGFLDSVEIIANFKPLDPQSEAKFILETPQRTTEENAFDLKIKKITPTVFINNEVGTSQIFSEISGSSLFSDSFLTFIIEGNQTSLVNVAKTNEQGEFNFILEKELSDGDYKIFIIIPDNTGKILSRSQAFNFYKTGEKFINKNEKITATPSDIKTNQNNLSYSNTTASMGVVSLGIILLLLGQNLIRERKDDLK